MSPETTLDDLLDGLVAEYSERVAAGRGEQAADLVQQVPDAHRPSLERCFRMIRAGLTAPLAPRPVGPGSELDGYRVVREIGRGGMAVVFEAVQADLSRSVALKVLRPGLALDAKHVDRFRREALAVARLQHPHIVAVHAVGEAEGHHYIAMELVHGRSLAEVYERLPKERDGCTAADLAAAAGVPALAESGSSFEQALCALLAPVVRAVGLAHELGMVHRDVKPSNILLHADGRAVIADFGLAKGEGDPALSLTGEPVGTPYYMSPEQAAVIHDPVDHRSDVYSFGVTLYEGLTGRRPFEGQSFYEVLEAIRGGYAPSPRSVNRAVGKPLDAVVRKAMARSPEQRYTGALELSTELDAVAQGRLTRATAEEGGLTNRVANAFQRVVEYGARNPERREYRSKRTFLGLPLVHTYFGPRAPGEPIRVAKGWIACGEVAIGGIAMGAASCGLVSAGGIGAGGLVWAGMGIGGVTFAGLSIGLLAFGGCAIGIAALGGCAIGYMGLGGKVVAPVAPATGEEFFRRLWEGVTGLF